MTATAAAPTPSASVPLHLHCELFWGKERTEVRGFDPEVGKVLAASDERAAFPLYGFPTGDASFILAEWTPQGLVVYPPPGATKLPDEGAAGPLPHPIEVAGRQGFLVGNGTRLRFQSPDDVILQLTVSPVGFRAKPDHSSAITWVMVVVVMFVIIPATFLFFAPDPAETQDYAQRTLQREREKERQKQVQKRGGSADDDQHLRMQEPPPEDEDAAPKAVFPTTVRGE